MRVILLQDVKGLGKKFDVKEVKEGYGRNFLILNGLAQFATREALQKLHVQRAAQAQEDAALVARLRGIVARIHASPLSFLLKTGRKGEIFGSVSKEDIKHILCETIPELYECAIAINLSRSIKKVGTYDVPVDLGRGIQATIKIEVKG